MTKTAKASKATPKGSAAKPAGWVDHPTADARAARGKAARAAQPHDSHAAWEAPADRADPIAILEAQAASRVPDLIPIRYGRMKLSPFTFYRGAAAIMAADLATTPKSGIRVQLCGDAHLANFGGFSTPERNLVFDINDFDETLPGPWEWDVKRLAASFAVAGRDRDFTTKERKGAIMSVVGSYREAMRAFAQQRNLDVWYTRFDVAEVLERFRSEAKEKSVRNLDKLVAKAHLRDSLGAFAKLTTLVDGVPRIAGNPPLIVPLADLVPPDQLAEQAKQLEGELRKYRKTLPRDRRVLLEEFQYTDFARKVVGVGSVGTRAWIMLLMGRDGDDPLFLQVKEAQTSVLAPYVGSSSYANQGQRVVEGQKLTQAASDIFLGWIRTDGVDGVSRDYYFRQLMDGKVSADLDRMPARNFPIYGQMCGWTLARAHARSGDRIALASYLGGSTRFDEAMVSFAEAYADQNERDHQALVTAIDDGRIEAIEGI